MARQYTEDSKSVPRNPDSEVLFRGTITRITFRNEDSGFGVFRAEPASPSEFAVELGGSEATLVGVAPGVTCGATIVARGEWEVHPRFGRQLRAWSVTEIPPSSRDGLLRYLSAGAVKGVGPALAQRIVDTFGEDALKIIEQSPERLLEVPGIGEKKLQELRDTWDLRKNRREVLLFFHSHGIGDGLANRLYLRYGDRAIETVKQNPYLLVRDMHGIGFKTADKIALAVGFDHRSPFRVQAGVLYTLKRAAEDGHCFLPDSTLITKTGSLLGLDDQQLIEEAIKQREVAAELIREGDRLYLPELHQDELDLANSIASRLAAGAPDLPINAALVSEVCSAAQVTNPDQESLAVLRLSAEQREAVSLAGERQIVVVTGGPGCGKTTVIRTIAALFRRASLSVKLAAPTGRAAQRLSEVCGMEASTIHRLLKFDPVGRGFLHNKEDPLPLDAIILDECSMIDLPLAASLFRALPKGIRIVIVGDADQLPSVGPGLFLRDLLDVEQLPRVRLNTLFRRADHSSITQVAHLVNSGVVPSIPEPDGVTKSDSYFITAKDQPSGAALVESLVCDQIPRKFGFRPEDITVLSPMNQGQLGIVELNQRLQTRLVPQQPGMPHVRVGNMEFRLGDRVCQRVNNYNIVSGGVFNGDQGRVVGIDLEAKSLVVRLWDGREVTYSNNSLSQLDLAYSITVHRSQGSEVPVVVLALHDSHAILLERQLIYTAITRAKRLLIIVGTRKALATATRRTYSKRRYTGLSERIVTVATKGSGQKSA